MASFFVIHGNIQGQRLPLKEPACLVGRESTCDVCLQDTEVSRRHAVLKLSDAAPGTDSPKIWTITDQNSSNGTFVNGEKIAGSRVLHPGDSVQAGGTVMLFMPDSESLPDGRRLSPKVAVSFGETDLPAEPAPPSDTELEISLSPTGGGAKILRTITPSEGERFIADMHRSASAEGFWKSRAEGYLQVLHEMTLAVSRCMDPDRLANELLDLILRWIEADRGCILLFDPATNCLEPRAKKVRRDESPAQRMIISKTILDYVLENRIGVLTSDATQDDRWNTAASVLKVGIREVLCVPLQGRYGIVGAIYLDTYSPPDIVTGPDRRTHRFGDDDLKLMITIAYHTALAIEDTRYYRGMLQAERLAAIGQTVAGISHHIKNILQGIRGGSYLIEMGLGEHDQQLVSRGWKIVDRNQRRISSLVMDMLTLSKERTPERMPCDLNRLLGEMVEHMQPQAQKADVLLVWAPDPEMPEMRFDPEGIHHAILNVVTNAIDAAAETPETSWQPGTNTEYTGGESKFPSPEGRGGDSPPSEEWRRSSLGGSYALNRDCQPPRPDGHPSEGGEFHHPVGYAATPPEEGNVLAPRGQVEIQTLWDAPTASASIIIQDTGPGIPPDQVSRVFTLFESTKGNRGTGLGLPVCKKIITEHGGTIRVEQRVPHGCRFIITLPAETR